MKHSKPAGFSWYHVEITKHYSIWAPSAQQAREHAAHLYQVPLADVVLAQPQPGTDHATDAERHPCRVPLSSPQDDTQETTKTERTRE